MIPFALLCLAPPSSPVLYAARKPGWILIRKVPFGTAPSDRDVERLRLKNPPGTTPYGGYVMAASRDRSVFLVGVVPAYGGEQPIGPSGIYLCRRGLSPIRLTQTKPPGNAAGWISADGQRYAFVSWAGKRTLGFYRGMSASGRFNKAGECPTGLPTVGGEIQEIGGELLWWTNDVHPAFRVSAGKPMVPLLPKDFGWTSGIAPHQNLAFRFRPQSGGGRAGTDALLEGFAFDWRSRSRPIRLDKTLFRVPVAARANGVFGIAGRNGRWLGRESIAGTNHSGKLLVDFPRRRLCRLRSAGFRYARLDEDRLITATRHDGPDPRLELELVDIPRSAWKPFGTAEAPIDLPTRRLMTFPWEAGDPFFLLDSPNTILRSR